MMALLVYRQGRFTRVEESSRIIPTENSDTWMAIYAGPEESDAPIGYVNTTAIPGKRGNDNGVQYAMTLRLDTRLFGERTQLDLRGSSWVSAADGLRDFQFRVDSGGGHAMRATGVVEDGRLKLEVETAGQTFPMSFPVSSDLLVRGGFGTTALNLPAMEVGDTVSVDAFDPVTLSKGTAYLTCLDTEVITVGEESILTKIIETDLGGIKSKAWVTPEGEVLRVDSPLGFRLRVVPRAEALAALESPRSAEPLLNALAVRPENLQPFRGARRMRFTVTGLPDGIAPVLDELQREVSAGIYEIIMPSEPVPGAVAAAASFREDFLEGDAFIQTGHPDIVEHAEDIAGAIEGTWPQARALAEWVFASIDKRAVLSFPSALDVLQSLEGDCNEHTVLYTALSRSLGIPTRVAVGLVWSDELNGFYYHAWPEVNAGEWIPIDPTLGQPIADATHIKLIEGSVEDWPRLAPFLGQIHIEVLEVE
jgi:transglutaminase-like putative cysteine protease